MTIGKFHSNPRSTEVESAIRIGPDIKTLKQACLKLVKESGDSGTIPFEAVAEIRKWRPNTPESSVRQRFNDLWEDGEIVRNGKTRKNGRDSSEEVWVAGFDPESLKKKKEQRAKKIKLEELKKELEDLKSQPLKKFSDDQLVKELEDRGFVVTKAPSGELYQKDLFEGL